MLQPLCGRGGLAVCPFQPFRRRVHRPFSVQGGPRGLLLLVPQELLGPPLQPLSFLPSLLDLARQHLLRRDRAADLTHRLVEGLFHLQDHLVHHLPGILHPGDRILHLGPDDVPHAPECASGHRARLLIECPVQRSPRGNATAVPLLPRARRTFVTPCAAWHCTDAPGRHPFFPSGGIHHPARPGTPILWRRARRSTKGGQSTNALAAAFWIPNRWFR